MRKINRIQLFVNDNNKSREVAKKIKEELVKYKFKIVDKVFLT